MKTTKEDYSTEQEREAYRRGIVARINGMTLADCPYSITFDDAGKDNVEICAWLDGYSEKGSAKQWLE